MNTGMSKKVIQNIENYFMQSLKRPSKSCFTKISNLRKHISSFFIVILFFDWDKSKEKVNTLICVTADFACLNQS